jgi:signal transduction histidine kinase/CheY-like chemotaxis protein
MSTAALATELKATWRLLWGQRLGRAVLLVFGLPALIYLFELGPVEWREWLSMNIDRVVLLPMIILLLVRTRRVQRVEERRFWNLMALGLILWLSGSLLYLASYSFEESAWLDLAVDCCYILLYLFMFLASDQQPQLADGWSARDVLYPFSMAAASLFIVIMFGYFVVVPWSIQPPEYARYLSSFNLYVTLDLLLTVRFVLLFRAARSEGLRRCFALLATATGVLAVGDLLEGLGFAGYLDSVMGERIDAIWLIPHFLVATMIITCAGRSSAEDEEASASAHRVQSLLPFYAFALPVIHIGLYLVGGLDPAAQTHRAAIVFTGLVVFGVLNLVQQMGLERAVASLRSELTVRALDDRLRQSQRMESIGRLAGGVAHDLNNLLMVIKGYTELASRQLSAAETRTHDRLNEIDRAADRAAALIRQLLAFGRRQVLKPEIVHVNDLIRGLQDMLSRILGEDVELIVDLSPDAGFTKADPALLEQVVINLAANARDAMPRGGRLTIATTRCIERTGGILEAETPVRMVELAVTDTGVGIDPEIQDRIFEPYFTTKEMEKGTGLGLATVYGIVQQSGGTIEVVSEPGRGSTFKVQLPQVRKRPAAEAPPVRRDEAAIAGRTVLLTEDEENIREALAEYLGGLGIQVLQAADGVDALKVASDHEGTIDVLVTDLVMPRMNGPDLARHLVKQRQDLKVVYVSGYTPEAMQEYGASRDDAVFLQKPFQLSDLRITISEVLER